MPEEGAYRRPVEVTRVGADALVEGAVFPHSLAESSVGVRGNPRTYGQSVAPEPMSEVEFCPHRPACPGCPRLGERALDPEGLRALETLALEQGAPFETFTVPGAGHRHRARLSVRLQGSRPRLGLFEEGSHRLVAVDGCGVQHPALNDVATSLEASFARHGIEAYDEASHRGVVRAVQLAVERETGLVQLVLVCRDRLGPGSHARAHLAPVLRELEGTSMLQALFLNAQPERNNVLLGDTFERIFGEPFLKDRSGSARVFYSPGAFAQANPLAHDESVRRIHAGIAPGARVLELYAGVGSIGLGLARTCALALNEIGRGSLEGLRAGVAALGGEDSGLRVLEGPAESHTAAIAEADVVVVDPPRKGLSPQVVSELCRTPPTELWYLSCGKESFLRDARALGASFRLRSVTALGYFPYTTHIETLARFEKK